MSTTYRELVYASSDLNKLLTDDSTITEEHILFLLAKYRNYILNQYFGTQKRVLGQGNYQNVCVDVDLTNNDFCGGETMLKSVEKFPFTMTIGRVDIAPPAGFYFSRIRFIDYNEFRYAGNNKYIRNEIYATIGPDGYLYVKSNNTNAYHLRKFKVTAIFDDILEASKMECDDNCIVDNCDILDKVFPIENSYIPGLLKAVQQDIISAALTPRDDTNNASDEQDTMAQVISNYLNTAGKRLLKRSTGTDDETES